MPPVARLALRITEQILLLVLAAFVVSQSYFYAAQMLRIGRRSDMAGVPMWIPHGFLVAGFSLIFVVALWRLAGIVRSPNRQDGGAQP
jgi:TRAP-type C4-dicarboxylate transport system permease small subunit